MSPYAGFIFYTLGVLTTAALFSVWSLIRYIREGFDDRRDG